jgi:hypothetical protein
LVSKRYLFGFSHPPQTKRVGMKGAARSRSV